MHGSFRNLAALVDGGAAGEAISGSPLNLSDKAGSKSHHSIDSNGKYSRCIVVANRLPLKVSKSEAGEWQFDWDEGALIFQAKDGLAEGVEPIYIGSLPVHIPTEDQEAVALELLSFDCYPVFLDRDLSQKFYQGFCKQQLWPLFHYMLPLDPKSTGRFNLELWQAYVKANKQFADKVVENINVEEDYVWVHDYHLLALPSLLRKVVTHVRLGLFLHSPFPSSEVFRTFPRRDELLRSLLNADLIGFHTFDYARHFLSCCSRMLGLEHVTQRGSIIMEYYGRNVGVKILPTGVAPERFLAALKWQDTVWRRGELLSQFEGQTVLVGVDDMDLFKGIELKLLALEQLLDRRPEWRGKLTLIQVSLAPRSSGRDLQELNTFCTDLVKRINDKYSKGAYTPVVWLDRPVPLYERVALYSVADCALVTCVRDGMNLVPYEYTVCRQGVQDVPEDQRTSMLVLSEFVGCSPSVSGAIRVNPWSVDDVADRIHEAIRMPRAEQHLRHNKHWRYISHHTVTYWAQSLMADLEKVCKDHREMRCYKLGLGLDTFRMVALTKNFAKLEASVLQAAYARASKRLLLLDYDGTLSPGGGSSGQRGPSPQILSILHGLCADPANVVFIISGRGRDELRQWFSSVAGLGLAAEHGYFMHWPNKSEWEALTSEDSHARWKELIEPIMQVYTESTDGTYIESKESALVWHYSDADPDFGAWQAKEMLDHLEGVLANEPVETVMGAQIVEVKPSGVSKGGVVERIMRNVTQGGSPELPDFVFCCGDDRSDEDMFRAVERLTGSKKGGQTEVFACTVGQKPSKAPFWVDDEGEVGSLLAMLTESPSAGGPGSPQGTHRGLVGLPPGSPRIPTRTA